MRTPSTALLALGVVLLGACGSSLPVDGSGGSGGSASGGMVGSGGFGAAVGTGGGAAGHGGGGSGTGGVAAGGHSGQSGHGGGGQSGHGGVSGCRAPTDCTPGALCTAPGQPRCGGACLGPQHPCTADSDCASDGGAAGAPSICAPVACSCPAAKGCQPGCRTDAECAAGTICGTDHHCAVIDCPVPNTTDGCPPDFVCGSQLICVRKPCQSDAVCTGACVQGTCYASAGFCWLPVP